MHEEFARNSVRRGEILLVEDNPVDIDLTQRAFQRRKLANPIRVVRDGEAAVGMLEHWHGGGRLPEVVLLDIKLPKLDGIEVLRAYRNDPLTATLPVVMLTSSAEDRDIRRAYDAGANSYIVKPVSFERFLEVAAEIELYWCVLNQLPEGGE